MGFSGDTGCAAGEGVALAAGGAVRRWSSDDRYPSCSAGAAAPDAADAAATGVVGVGGMTGAEGAALGVALAGVDGGRVVGSGGGVVFALGWRAAECGSPKPMVALLRAVSALMSFSMRPEMYPAGMSPPEGGVLALAPAPTGVWGVS